MIGSEQDRHAITISSPHDALFKVVFGRVEHARGQLRAIVPPVLVEALDRSTLTLRPGRRATAQEAAVPYPNEMRLMATFASAIAAARRMWARHSKAS